jgi:hypothetical protein
MWHVFFQLCGKVERLHNSRNGLRYQESEEEKQKDPSIYSRSLSLKKQIILNNNNF